MKSRKLVTYGTGALTVEDIVEGALAERLRSINEEARAIILNGRNVPVLRPTLTSDGTVHESKPTVADLLGLHNAVARVPVTRFVSREAAIKATTKAVSAAFARSEGGAPASAVAKVPGGKPPTYPNDALVRLKVEENPKRAGGKNRKRFDALMKTVCARGGVATVAEVLEAGVTRGDLRYDAQHNYIEVIEGVRPNVNRSRRA